MSAPGSKAEKAKPRARQRASATTQAPLEGSPEAKRLASLVLEVLGGLRTPAEASAAGGITLQRYYRLETRAIQAVVASLERRSPGRKPESRNELARLQAERDRLERELRRAHALVRVAQRTVGLPQAKATDPSAAKPTKKGEGKGKGRRKHRPRVRVRQVVARLRDDPPAGPAPASAKAPAPPRRDPAA